MVYAGTSVTMPGTIIVAMRMPNRMFLPLNLSFAKAYAANADVNSPISVGGIMIHNVFRKPVMMSVYAPAIGSSNTSAYPEKSNPSIGHQVKSALFASGVLLKLVIMIM